MLQPTYMTAAAWWEHAGDNWREEYTGDAVSSWESKCGRAEAMATSATQQSKFKSYPQSSNLGSWRNWHTH